MEVKYILLDESARFEDFERYQSILTPERIDRISRYRFDRDKLRSLVAGLLIYNATGGAELFYGEHDKPYMKDGGLYFSVSHSGDVVAIATDSVEVGCDVEYIVSDNRLKIADRFYHPSERDYVARAEDRLRAFTRVWTRKEAYLKMTGEGISSDLTAFDTVLSPLSEQIATFDMDGWMLSVCSEAKLIRSDIYISELELKDLEK